MRGAALLADRAWLVTIGNCLMCRQALKPRLLVPVALAAGMAAYNHMAEQPLQGMEQASLLVSFLSYKVRGGLHPAVRHGQGPCCTAHG